MARNKSCVIIEGCIALPAETIKDNQQTSMFLVDARSHEIDDGDVVPRLTSRMESMGGWPSLNFIEALEGHPREFSGVIGWAIPP
jgi:hypothetical protein